MNNLISWFQETFPIVIKKMANCNHHYTKEDSDVMESIHDVISLNPYHLEGTVLTHTMMVCNQLDNNDKYHNKSLIQLSALLHDVGKCLTRTVVHETERVRFFGHESMSAFLALDVLKKYRQDYGLTDREIVHIFELICLHTEPFKLLPDKLAERLVHNHELFRSLRILSNADSNGRITSEPHILLDELKIENRTSDEVTDKEIILLVGLPCSGKSTFLQENEDKYEDFTVLSRDSLVMSMGEGNTYTEKWKTVDQKKVDKEMEKLKRESFNVRENVIVDMTNLSRKARRKWLNQVPKGYKKTAHVFLSPLSVIEKRNDMRKGKYIPDEVYNRMCGGFYPPLMDEFDEVNYELSGF